MARRAVIKRNDNYQEITLKEAFEEFIVEKEAVNSSKATIKNYLDTWVVFKEDLDINDEYFELEDITLQVIYTWISILRERLKVSSINSYLAKIRTFLYWCMDEERGYIRKPYSIHLLKNQETPPKHYSEKEVAKLIVKPKVKDKFLDWRSWAIISFILATGARASTVSNMVLANLDFTNKEICLGYTKNNKALIVPMSPALELALRDYIKLWRNKARADEYLFPTFSNTMLQPKKIWKSVLEFMDKRGVEERNGIHGFRHTFAIGWVRNNGNMFALQQILGHSTLDMTKKYVKLFAEDIKVDFELYNPLDTAKRFNSRRREIHRNI